MEQAVSAAKRADEIRDRSAAWLARELPGSFVSVTAVTLSENKRYATLWISSVVMQDQVALVRKVRSLLPQLSRELNRSFGRRVLPELRADIAGESFSLSEADYLHK